MFPTLQSTDYQTKPMRIAHPPRSFISAARHFLSPPRLSKPLSYSRALQAKPVTLALSMATDNISTAAGEVNGVDEEEVKYGFRRPEMYKSNLAGTIDAYDRHVFLCFKSPESWLSRVEDSEADPLPKLLSSALKTRKDDITVKTKLTICEGREGTEFADGDVLIFPEMIKYRGLNSSNVDSFVDDVIVNGKPWASGVQDALTGSHVFVCAHGSRDRRCGVCGPVLIEKLNEGIQLRGLKDQVFVSPCSHIGGHKYAGNLIIYSPDSEGKIMGHWYGYVTPEDVSELLDQHIGKGVTIERLWRGQMGPSAEEGEKADKQKPPNRKEKKKSKKHEENGSQAATEVNVVSCCQGVNGFSCCRDGILEKSGNEEKKGLGRVSSWIGKLEQGDVLAGVAVVGAVATVAVAYGFYRRSS